MTRKREKVGEWIDRTTQLLDILDVEEQSAPDEFELFDGIFDVADAGAIVLIEYLNEAMRWKRAANIVRKLIENRLKRALDGNSVLYGDKRYYVTPDVVRKLKDREGFVKWLADDFAMVVSMPLDGGKKKALDAVCAQRDVKLSTILDSFFVFEDQGRIKLGAIPVEKGEE